jgi:phosphoribosyl 1,2-cyclic phosphodiesterase
VTLHDAPLGEFEIEGIQVCVGLVLHPGPTLGYRLIEGGRSVVYIPDHEPALGGLHGRDAAKWTSGYALSRGADVLIHDAQYLDDEYTFRVGWGHSTPAHALALAELAEVGRLVTFHHDPSHSDEELDELHRAARGAAGKIEVVAGVEGLTFDL